MRTVWDRSRAYLGFVVLTLGVLLVSPALGQAGDCASTCTTNSSCDQACRLDFEYHGSWSTCGQWGVCCSWVEVDRVEIGRHQSGLPPAFCTYWVSYLVTQAKICDPGSTRQYCQDVHDGTGINMNCCEAWGCWGQQC
jgi:hypothetical protein